MHEGWTINELVRRTYLFLSQKCTS